MPGVLEAASQRNLRNRSAFGALFEHLALTFVTFAIAGTSIGLSQLASMNSSTVLTVDDLEGSGSRSKRCV
jgi:hypothetical protein